MPRHMSGSKPGMIDFGCELSHTCASEATIVVCGELDLATMPTLERALQGAPARAVVDLRGLTFMDCSSLSVLVAATADARAAGGRLRVMRGTTLGRLFTLTGIEPRLDMTA